MSTRRLSAELTQQLAPEELRGPGWQGMLVAVTPLESKEQSWTKAFEALPRVKRLLKEGWLMARRTGTFDYGHGVEVLLVRRPTGGAA